MPLSEKLECTSFLDVILARLSGHVWNCDLPFMEMLIDTKQRSNNQFFKSALIAGCWSLWNRRNKIIFDNEQRDLEACFAFFKSLFSLIRHRVKPSLKEGMQDWLDLL